VNCGGRGSGGREPATTAGFRKKPWTNFRTLGSVRGRADVKKLFRRENPCQSEVAEQKRGDEMAADLI